MTPSGSDEHILGSSSSASSSPGNRSPPNWMSATSSSQSSTITNTTSTYVDDAASLTEQEHEQGATGEQTRRRLHSSETFKRYRGRPVALFSGSGNKSNRKKEEQIKGLQNKQMVFSANEPLHHYNKAPVGPSSSPPLQMRTHTKHDATSDETPAVLATKAQTTLKPTGKSIKQTLKNWLILALFAIGLIICVTSLACLLLLPTFVSQQISRKLVLKNGSMLLERWSKPNVPMYFKVWIYNVKNAQELIGKRGTKPQVEEVGPFVFDLKRQKDVISFAGENLYYTERKIYKFNRELSCCAINTTVTIPNIPLVAVVDRALGYNLPLVGRFIPRLINRAIQSLREPMFVRKQAGEILFDGYDVELLKMVSRIGALVGLPQQSQRFALLKGRNDTWRPEQDGVWAINTGQQDRRMFGRVSSWNSYRKLPFWSAPQCNAINGSDGTLFPPPIKPTEPLYIFNQELCRTVNLVFDRPSAIRSIQAYRFVLNPMNFAHTVSSSAAAPSPLSSMNPLRSHAEQASPVSATAAAVVAVAQPAQKRQHSEVLRASSSEQRSTALTGGEGAEMGSQEAVSNLHASEQQKLVQEAQRVASERHKHRETPVNPQTCFCDRKTTNLNGVNVCEFDGLIDLSKCSKQAQVIFGSMPHFYNSDPRLLRQVDGMKPNASRHTTYLDIEPVSSLPFIHSKPKFTHLCDA